MLHISLLRGSRLAVASLLGMASFAEGGTVIVQQYVTATAGFSASSTQSDFTDLQLQNSVSQYGCTGAGQTIIRPNQNVGMLLTADANSSYSVGAYAEGTVWSRTTFTVTTAGTFVLPVALEGAVAIPLDVNGSDCTSTCSQTIALEGYDSLGGWYVYGSQNGNGDSISNTLSVFRRSRVDSTNTSGLNTGEYALSNDVLTWNATRTISDTLAPGNYAITMKISGNSSTPVFTGSSYVDSYNCAGVSGSDFWSAVQGTAVFYDTDNPAIGHNVPEPAAMTLLAGVAGSVLLRRRRG